ncbi:hypothetical protein Acy02nite_41880 [Actinoplanes cyaneus]|uniref:Uncharacterized protein n=1 Tax=Actinoplanes cyaneus TaxID=52696 RepID=A0A919M549_9ACTN|nr:hypothetical protein [Actinoplanes cyaneus]MCW2138348.1 hypothetical protein [Actinoplanes cyaneus]GID66307.1 hypothetical protein Acy02nite_41880 [Actinoplanes cyaneus]
MTPDPKIADHPVPVLIGAPSCAAGVIAVVFTPAGLVPLAAGLALVFWHRLRPSAAGSAVGAVAGAAAGTFGTLAVRTEKLCCMFGWSESRGGPYAWLSRSGVADTPGAARELAVAAGWRPDVVHLLMDVAFWAYAGFLIVVVAGLAWRARPGR